MDGEILSNGSTKNRGGKMTYEFESDVKIDDDILKQELGANSDTKLKETLCVQSRRNKMQLSATRRTRSWLFKGWQAVARRPLRYIGSPIFCTMTEHLNSSNILILARRACFADYISHILPELGEENIQEMKF